MRRAALATVLPALAAIMALAGLAGEFRHTLNGDALSLLDGCRRILEGRELYASLVDLNPPFVFLFHMPFAWLAGRTALPPETLFRVGVVLLLLAAVLLTRRIARQVADNDPVMVGVLTAAALVAAFALPLGFFGQREHLQAALLLPAIVATAGRDGRVLKSSAVWESWAVCCLAGLGLALKVTSGLALLLPALLLMVRTKQWKSEAAAAIVVGGVLTLLGLLWAPGYLGVVRELGPLYQQFNAVPFAELFQRGILSMIPLATLAVLLVCSWRVMPQPLPMVLGLALVGYLAGVAVQGKGFGYHYYPALAMAVTSLLVLATARGDDQPVLKVMRHLSALTVLGLLLWPVLPILANRVDPALTIQEQRAAVLSALIDASRGSKVAVLSPKMADVYPLTTERGFELTGRWPHLWWLATECMTGARPCAASSAWRTDLLRSVAQDLAAERPDVVVARRAWPAPLGPQDLGFDVIPFLAQDPVIARELRHYAEVRRSAEFVVLRRR
jgi:hypothetical protein